MSEEVEIERLDNEPQPCDQGDDELINGDDDETKKDDETADDIIEQMTVTAEESTDAVQDPLSLDNENHKELELMNDINSLQTDLKKAESKANTLQQQLHAMEKVVYIMSCHLLTFQHTVQIRCRLIHDNFRGRFRPGRLVCQCHDSGEGGET